MLAANDLTGHTIEVGRDPLAPGIGEADALKYPWTEQMSRKLSRNV